MKQKITGRIITSKNNILYNAENLTAYIPLFSKYFENIGNCMYNVDAATLHHTVLIFSKLTSVLTSNGGRTDRIIEMADEWNYPVEDPIWELPYQNTVIPISIRVTPDAYIKRICEDSIVITLKNAEHNWVIGEFDPVRKILLLSDITHKSGNEIILSKMLNLLEQMGLIEERKVEKKKPLITLGADPEVEYINDDGDVVNCSECGIEDKVFTLEGSSTTGRIGHDGSGFQRELRPVPAKTPEEMVKNIRDLIEAGKDEVWSLRGEESALGGHIHVGGVDVSRDFGKILDHLFTPMFELNSDRRKSSRYGKPGSEDSIRDQKWGVEWRTPPSAWLASPKLTELTFKIVKAVAEKHYVGEDIELTDDYNSDLKVIAGLTDDEIKAFNDEIKSYVMNGLPRDLKLAWGISNTDKFILEIRDSWSNSVKSYLRELINNHAKINNWEGKCILYGVSSERGNVFSVVMAHMQGIDMPAHYGFMPPIKKESGVNHVGIPASIRGDLSEAKRNKDILLEIVKRTIQPPVSIPKFKKAKKMPVGIIREGDMPTTIDMSEFFQE